jgi:hypothetical protein
LTLKRLLLLLVAVALLACSSSRGSREGEGEGGSALATRSISEVLAAHADSLMALPGVVGTAIGLCGGERCITVLLADSNPETKRRIPDRLEGFRVRVEVTGAIRPH